jgi:hypothetical protein
MWAAGEWCGRWGSLGSGRWVNASRSASLLRAAIHPLWLAPARALKGEHICEECVGTAPRHLSYILSLTPARALKGVQVQTCNACVEQILYICSVT